MICDVIQRGKGTEKGGKEKMTFWALSSTAEVQYSHIWPNLGVQSLIHRDDRRKINS